MMIRLRGASDYSGCIRVDGPRLRTTLIIILCGCGFLFSVTGVVIAGRRILLSLKSSE
jgi:hypothetical protein